MRPPAAVGSLRAFIHLQWRAIDLRLIDQIVRARIGAVSRGVVWWSRAARRYQRAASTGDLGVDHGHDFKCVRLNNHNFLVDHEITVSTPSGMDTDERIRHFDEVDAARYYRADPDVEVHLAARDSRHIAGLQHGRANLRSLIGA